MNLIRLVAMALTLGFAVAASAALTDDEYMEYTGALSEGKIAVVKKYLDNGLDVNEKFFAWSALEVAAKNNQMEVVKYLVEKGADVNYKHPVTKMTAFHLAAFNGNKEMLQYLASKGANINSKLRGNVPIIRPLRDEGQNDMVEFLLAMGVKEDGCAEEKCN